MPTFTATSLHSKQISRLMIIQSNLVFASAATSLGFFRECLLVFFFNFDLGWFWLALRCLAGSIVAHWCRCWLWCCHRVLTRSVLSIILAVNLRPCHSSFQRVLASFLVYSLSWVNLSVFAKNPLWSLSLKFALAYSLFCQTLSFSVFGRRRLYLPYKVLSSWVFGRGQVICKQRLQWCSHWILRKLQSHRNKLSGNLRTNISETLSTASTGSKTGNSNPTSLSFHPTLCLE